MNDEPNCGNTDAFVSYIYDEMDAGDRERFEQHLGSCTACAGEIDGLRSVRTTLADWHPPETLLGFRLVREATVAPPAPSPWAWLQMPAWAQLAAASLIIGIATGLSGLEIRYDQNGLVVRTGWQKPAAQQAARQASPATIGAASSTASTPWRADLVALEQQLRRDFRMPVSSAPGTLSEVAATGGAPMSDDEFLSRVRSLIAASEQRQQRELALRLAEVVRDVDVQRRADLVRVADGLGVIEGRTGAAVAQQREALNYLMRVSQRQDPPR